MILNIDLCWYNLQLWLNWNVLNLLFKLCYIADGMTKILLNIPQTLSGQYDNID